MMKRYFKGAQPHINIDKIEAEIAFLPDPPERALEIAKKFYSYEKVTEQWEFATYKGDRYRRAERLRDFYGYRISFCGDCGGRVARHCPVNRRVHGERRGCICNYEVRITSKSNS